MGHYTDVPRRVVVYFVELDRYGVVELWELSVLSVVDDGCVGRMDCVLIGVVELMVFACFMWIRDFALFYRRIVLLQ